MNNSVKIVTVPAKLFMLVSEDFNYDGYLSSHMTNLDLTTVMTKQLTSGWSVGFRFVPDDDHPVFLALAGVIPDEETGHAEIWFLPGVNMPKYAKSLLKVMPKYIEAFLTLSDATRGSTLIDPTNAKFKKFAKLCKFHYSSTLEIDGVEFEEWEFGG